MKKISFILACILIFIFSVPLFSCEKETDLLNADNGTALSSENAGNSDGEIADDNDDKENADDDAEKQKFSAFFDLPVIELTMEEDLKDLSKEDYFQCLMSVKNAEDEFCFDSYTAQIRGRGNSSWNMPKKSFKLQFVKSDANGKKVNLFGNGEAKTWTLIANFCDKSLIRNYLAYSVAQLFSEEMPYTTTTQFAELYVNGEYLGVYLVCEQVQTGENRVNIKEDLVKKGNRILPENTGFLLELDGRATSEGDENVDYFIANGLPFAIKTPETDADNTDYHNYDGNGNGISDYLEYIKNYIEQVFNVLENGTYSKVCELVDVESFAASYIVHELFNCKDCGQSSFFIYKDGGGKLCSGPVWDFDISSGNCNFNDTGIEGDIASPELLWAKLYNPFYNKLLKYDEFKSLVLDKLSKKAESIRKTISLCVDYSFANADSFTRNFEKWDILNMSIWPNTNIINAIHTWREQVRYVEWWLNRSLNCMLENYTAV